MPEQSNANNRGYDFEKDTIERRLFVARAVEIAAITPLVALGINNAFGHRDYATIDSGSALRAVALEPELQKMIADYQALGQALDSVHSAYSADYHKSRVVPYMSTDSKGHATIRFHTEYYWDEERNAPKHDVIESWQSTNQNIRTKLQELSSPELIDCYQVNNLIVKTNHAGSFSQIGGSIVIAGAEIAALLGYEEVAGLRESTRESHGDIIESKDQLRRGFFKTCAALVGGAASLAVASKIDSRLSTGKERLEKAVSQAGLEVEATSDAAFNGHFTSSAGALISQIGSQRRLAENALANGITSTSVKSALKSFVFTAKEVEASFQKLFSDGVPESIANLCRSKILTKAVNDARSGESSLGELGILLEGLAVGGAMVATVVSLEAGSKYLPHSE